MPRRAEQQVVRERAAELFAEGRSAAAVADELGVARQTAVRSRARWQRDGAAALRSRQPRGRRPKLPDSQLPAIEQALLQGAAAHGFDNDVWTITRGPGGRLAADQRAAGTQDGGAAAA